MARNANKKTILVEAKKHIGRRSQWNRGVYEYAREIVENTAPIPRGLNRQLLMRHFLNGADDWEQASFGGCYLIRSEDIAERLAPPSYRARYLRRADGCDVLRDQARALYQAARRLANAYMRLGYGD